MTYGNDPNDPYGKPRYTNNPKYTGDSSPKTMNSAFKWIGLAILACIVIYVLFYFLIGHAVISSVTN